MNDTLASPNGGYPRFTKTIAKLEINKSTRPIPEVTKHFLTMLLRLSFLVTTQKATPKKIATTGLLNVKNIVYRKKRDSVWINIENKPGNRATNWVRK